MKRFIILLSILALLVSLSAVAFAAPPPGIPNNILDYKTSVEEYESGVMLIKGNVPLDVGQTRQYYINSNVRYNYQTFDRTWMHFDSEYGDIKVGSYLVGEIFPFGYFTDNNQNNLNKCISLKGLPNGTNFVLDAVVGGAFQEADFVDSYGSLVWRVYLSYYDKDGNALSGSSSAYTEYHYDDVNGPMIFVSIPINAPAEAVAFRIYYRFQTRVSSITSNDWYFEEGIQSIKYWYMINKSEYEAAISGYENDKIIGSIEDGFQNIDDVINDGYNRPLDPQLPSYSDRFEDLQDIENGLINDSEAYLNSYYDLLNSAYVDLSSLATSFTAVKAFLESVLGIPALRILVSISLLLGLSGTILGIINIAPNMRSIGEGKSLEKHFRKNRSD